MIFRWLRRLSCWRHNPGLRLIIGAPTEENDTMVELDALQQFRLRVAGGRDRKGNPAPLENIEINTTDPNVATVTPLDDGSGAVLVRGVGAGACDITIKADARIGDGEVPVSKALAVAVKAPEAIDVDLEVGELENQPD